MTRIKGIEESLVDCAAEALALVREQGLRNAMPGDALWATMEIASARHPGLQPNSFVATPEGAVKFLELSRSVGQIAFDSPDIDQQG
jgi:hypothetical protein